MPDMRLPIALALGAPNRLPEPFGAIDWSTLGTLDFEVPDLETFPCLALAYEAGRAGGTAPAILVGRQRGRGRGVPRRPASRGPRSRRSSQEVLNEGAGNADEIADVLEADRRARERAAVARRREECRVRVSDPFEDVEVDPAHGRCDHGVGRARASSIARGALPDPGRGRRGDRSRCS